MLACDHVLFNVCESATWVDGRSPATQTGTAQSAYLALKVERVDGRSPATHGSTNSICSAFRIICPFFNRNLIKKEAKNVKGTLEW